jgi:hypothetical protein
MAFASNNNAVLIDGCNNLRDLSVLLEVTENVGTTDGNGWSFQLNCYPPPGEYCQASQVNVFQYIVYVQNGSLSYEVQYWSGGASNWPSGYNPEPGTTPWLPCWPNDYFLSGAFATINGDTLPSRSQLQVALTTNDAGGVTRATFTYTDPDGDDHSAHYDLPAVHPIVACTLDMVGPGNSANANFALGLTSSRGIIYYSVSSGQLSVQNGGAGAACGEAGYGTAETSNMTYSDVSGAPGSTVTQILQQPVSCAIEHLMADDRGGIDEMHKLRDEPIAQYPAGQWLIEILERHSADLAVLVASDKDEIGTSVRELLATATRTATEGRVFDATTVDRALEVLRRMSCEFPPSMNAVRQAGETLLESLRGRTLDEGLKAASTTIRPRFEALAKPCKKCEERLAQRLTDLEERVSRLESAR